MRKLLILALTAPLTLLAACGGSSGSSPPPPPPPPPPAQVIANPGPPNVEPITVDAGPAALTGRVVNIAYVTVRICRVSTTQCQDVDHVQVDTGSSGLRILASALGSVVLDVEAAPGGLPVAECMQFADGSSFGPVALADVVMPTSGQVVSGMAVHVIGATTFPQVPADCPGQPENDVASFGANGILGVGPFIQDCGPACADAINFPSGWYYTCPSPTTAGGCVAAAIDTTQQVSNPVVFFNGDNNGVIVELPAVADSGATMVGGSLVFGIGTETNNGLDAATVLLADTGYAYIQATYKGTTFMNAAIDSGSSANFFSDSSFSTCTVNTALYCPGSTVDLTATLQGVDMTMLVADFTLANADSVLGANSSATAMPGLGGPILVQSPGAHSIQFDLGMPFHFGRNVFTAIEGQATPGGTGPYYAY